MTREAFFEMQMQALRSLREDMEEHQRNPVVLDSMRDEMEKQYQALLKKQAEWENGGFWTPENERKYNEKYKDQ